MELMALKAHTIGFLSFSTLILSFEIVKEKENQTPEREGGIIYMQRNSPNSTLIFHKIGVASLKVSSLVSIVLVFSCCQL